MVKTILFKLFNVLLFLILLGSGVRIHAENLVKLSKEGTALNKLKVKPVSFSVNDLKLNTYNSFLRLYKPSSSKAKPPTYSKHYIAPAPWQYWSKANQIVITTESTTTVTGTISKSDGTFIKNFSCSATVPFVDRFTGLPSSVPVNPLNTVVSGAGLIVECTASISVNLRNIASDNLGSDGTDADIKGNASLLSFGDAGIGTSFRVGYYRDGDLAGTERPIYSIMALENNTTIKIGGVATTTLNAGQSYLFRTPLGTLVESSGAAVMNTSARLDAPGGCGDGAYNPIPPIVSLGSEYVIVRGEGNLIAEQTTVVASEANTQVTVYFYDDNGVQKDVKTYTLAQAGDFTTFGHGYITGTYNQTTNTGKYSSSRIVTTKNVVVFSGTGGVSGGGGCEVDVATLVPIATCAGSKRVETFKFTSYNNGNLPYFGYILTKSTDPIILNTQSGSPNYTNKDIETIAGIGVRKNLGTSGLSLIKFTDANIGYPSVITINSNSRLTVSMVQQSSDFSMSNFISRFAEKAEQPTLDMTDCTAAVLTASASSTGPYQWYLNGVPIANAFNNTYVATTSGNYTVTSTLECGMSAQSLPFIISLCNIDRSITKSVDIPLPEVGDVVSFTLKANNLGSGNAIGVSVTDLLPVDYQYVSNTASDGTYDPLTGVWSIGSMNSNAEATLVIKARVLTAGVHTNNASITGTQPDNFPTNDQSSASTSTTLGTVTLVTVGSADRNICVNTAIEDIVFLIGGGASGANVTNLPPGLTGSYDPATKKFTISGTVNTATSPAGITYTVTTTGGIPVSKTGVIIVKDNVTTPVFASGLTLARCMGAGSDVYTATSSNSDGMVYSFLPATAGSIDPVTGRVTWAPDFTGTATITAKATGCIEKTADLEVTINALPLAPVVSNIAYCKDQPSVALTAALTETSLIWYDNAGNVIAVPTPSTTTVGTTDYYVSQKNANGCESAKSKITVTINALPLAPVVSNIAYCKDQPSAALTAALTETSLIWYDNAGNILVNAPTPSTTTVGTTDYYVSQKNANGCESAKSKITVTINALPLAPVVSNIAYCKDQPSVALTAALTETSLIWYDNAGNILANAPTPSTATVGTTDYYVSQKNANGCESAKSKITVTINTLPLAPVVSDIAYCKDQASVALTAALTETSLIWYDNAGNVIAVPTPSTATIGTTDYYVSQKNANGCESAKSKITVTINALPLAPVVSDIAYCKDQPSVALTAALTEMSLIWYDNAGNILANAPTPSTATVGTTDYYVSQKNVNGCESAKSKITVTINTLPLAPVVSDIAYCKDQPSVALTAALTETNLIWYDNAGNVIAVPTPSTATIGTTDYYVSQKNANGCESAKSKITVTINALPLAPVVSDIAYCKDQPSVALTAALTETNLIWYDNAGNVIAVPTPSTATVGTTDYYVSQKNVNGCESAKSKITVTINALPLAPVVSDIAYCKDQPSVALTAALTETNLIWYDNAGNVIAVPTPSTATIGTTDYYVSQKNANGCESAKSKITVTINALPLAPVVSDIAYCKDQPSVALTAALTETNLIWYDNAGNVIAVPTPSTATVGTTDYYVSQKNANGCESAKSKITVTINALPLAPVVSNIAYCKDQPSAALTAALTETSLIWYDNAGNVIAVPTPSTATVGTIDYYVSQKNANGCESAKSKITVTINALPLAPVVSNVAYCKDQPSVALTAALTETSLIWYDNAGNILANAPTPSTGTVGTTDYYVSQKNANGCESAKSKITVTINALPLAPVVSNVAYCKDQASVALTAALTETSLIWYDNAGNVIAVPTPSTANVGATDYYVSQKNANGCESAKSKITVTINALPLAPVVSNVAYCKDQPSVALTAALTETSLIWYDNAGNVIAVPTPSTANIGTADYYVSQKNANGCESAKSKITVTINALPLAPVVSDIAYCKDQPSVALTAALTETSLIWYDNAGNVIAVPTPSTATVGTTDYYVSQKNANGCESAKSKITVTINALPLAPVVSDIAYCKDQPSVALTAALTETSLIWYDNTGNVIAVPTPSTATVGTTDYYVSQKNANGCESAKSKITVTINSLPLAPVVSNIAYCKDQPSVALTAALTETSLIWYDNAGNVIAVPTPSTATVGTTDYYVSQKNANGCESAKSKITVTINALPLAPVVSNIAYCKDQPSVALTAALTETSLIWYDNAGNVIAVPTPSTANVGTTDYYVSQKNANGCESAKSKITVTINALPLAPVVSDIAYCKDQPSVALTAALTETSLIWYDNAGNVIAVPTPSTANVGTTDYYVSQKNANGCESAKSKITVYD
jgi:uncharacterized repeat protein (TIGR01451 family)